MFDSHLHIVDPRFPLIPNRGYLPYPFTATDYRCAVGHLDVRGGAVVSGSFQGFDQSYLLDALSTLGRGFVGVTQLPATTTAERIGELHDAGVRAVRFNLVRGGSAGLDDVDALGRLAHETAGWSSEFYVRSADLATVGPVIRRLPRASIDHLGLTADGLGGLLDLVQQGVRVKATGFGRWTGGPAQVVDVMRRIHAINPAALLFGTDLPGTRAPRPFRPADLELIGEAVGPDLDRVMSANAFGWYGIPGLPPTGSPRVV